jgi:hypothetical protein
MSKDKYLSVPEPMKNNNYIQNHNLQGKMV